MMTAITALRSQTHYNFLATLRGGATLFMGVIMPIGMYLFMSGLFGDAFGEQDAIELRGAGEVADMRVFLTGGWMAYAVVYGAFTSLTTELADIRETGVLKRLRGTPLPLWTFVAARFVVALLVTVATVATIGVLGLAIYGADFPAARLAGFAVYTIAGTLTWVCLSFAITTIVKSSGAASGIVNGISIPLSMISGVFFDPDILPGFLNTIAQFLPMEPLANGYQSLYASGSTGIGLDARNLAVLAAWGIAGLIIALRRFHWDPRQRR